MIIEKLKLGVRYKQNCELGYGDSAMLLAHIEQIKNAISEHNDLLTNLKKQVADGQEQIQKLQQTTSKKKGKKK